KDRVGQDGPEKAALDKEGQDLLQAIGEVPFVVALTPEGKLYDSSTWAKVLQKWIETYPTVAFVIGGPAGFSPEILQKTNARLALSPMTFTHEMARVIFLEQLYRAFTILGGEKYHK